MAADKVIMKCILKLKDCGRVLWKLKVFREVNFTKYFVAIKTSNLHPNIKAFLDFTFSVIEQGKPQIAAFTFGREDLIPSMFTEILKNFQTNFPDTDLKKLIHYFAHIEIDADEHGPMAMKMITELCGDDEQKMDRS
jgi:hypothetical protein